MRPTPPHPHRQTALPPRHCAACSPHAPLGCTHRAIVAGAMSAGVPAAVLGTQARGPCHFPPLVCTRATRPRRHGPECCRSQQLAHPTDCVSQPQARVKSVRENSSPPPLLPLSPHLEPRSWHRPCRRLAPSSSMVRWPLPCSICSRERAMADLPLPLSPDRGQRGQG